MDKYQFLKNYIEALDPRDQEYYELDNPERDEIIGLQEQRYQIQIPLELREFYHFAYGANLNDYKILTISEIAKFLSNKKKEYEDSWKVSYLPFIYVLGVGDFFAFDLQRKQEESYLIVDCFHEWPVNQWKGIEFGLQTWLLKMTENEFMPYWLKST